MVSLSLSVYVTVTQCSFESERLLYWSAISDRRWYDTDHNGDGYGRDTGYCVNNVKVDMKCKKVLLDGDGFDVGIG